MNMKKILLSVIVLSCIMSCSKEEAMIYDKNIKDGIYIQQIVSTTLNSSNVVTSYTYSDSLIVSLVNQNANKKEFILSVPVKVMGNIVDYDRKISFRLNKSLTTAIEGEDFVINYDTAKVRSGKNKANLNIKLFRTHKLTKQKIRIAVELIENEYFDIYLDKYKSNNPVKSTSKDLSAVIYKFIISDMPKEPFPWWFFFAGDFFGDWSVNKFVLINTTMGWSSSSWDKWGEPGNYPNYGKLTKAADIVRDIVQKAANKGEAILDDNGDLMQFPEPYNIDYSKYEKNK